MELFVIFSPLVGAILAGFGWKIIGEKAALISATFLLFWRVSSVGFFL